MWYTLYNEKELSKKRQQIKFDSFSKPIVCEKWSSLMSIWYPLLNYVKLSKTLNNQEILIDCWLSQEAKMELKWEQRRSNALQKLFIRLDQSSELSPIGVNTSPVYSQF